MVGIWPEIEGEVLLDGTPMAQWNREAIGPHIGYLPQDVELLSGTLAENIARFSEVDAEAVVVAAQKTGVHDMVLRFPKGYDTPLGEAGGALSGGQRQRVGLARAVYRSPSLIVLDEPNANLDDAGEQALESTIRQLREEGSTVFLITHRPGILRVADHLVVMERGLITHAGPRQEVMARLHRDAPETTVAASNSNNPLPAQPSIGGNS